MTTICAIFLLSLFALEEQAVADNLADRYAKMSCAVVRIQAGNEIGTGFFVNADGILVTAAHVLFNRTFVMVGTNPALQLGAKTPISVTFYDGQKKSISTPTLTDRDKENAIYDLAAIETGLKTPCFLPIGDPNLSRVGERVIAIGFPGSSNSGVLYEGFISSKHTNVPTVVGPVVGTTQTVSATRNVMRVQMPVTAGASGSPTISDKDETIGVLSEIPVQWTQELARVVDAYANKPGGSGVILSGFDTTKILSELAWVVREFESPGAGLAVPVSYLKLPAAKTPPKP